MQHYKDVYDLSLRNADFSDVYYYVVRFDNIPDFLCSAPHMPDYDFTGKALQDVYDMSIIVDHIMFSLIATESGGAAVFSWVGKNSASEQFVNSLNTFSDHELPHAIVRFTFEYFENVFASPIRWEGLDVDEQQMLLQRQSSGLPSFPHVEDCLVDDGLRAVNWRVISRETNIF